MVTLKLVQARPEVPAPAADEVFALAAAAAEPSAGFRAALRPAGSRPRGQRCHTPQLPRPRRPVAEPALVPAPAPALRAPAGSPARVARERAVPPPVRLTRRGRALVRTAVLLAVVLVALVVTVASRADDVTPVASRSMVVAEDQTLWSIALEVEPDQPRSTTMAEIRELNHMPDNTVRVGQRLLLPAASR